MFHLQYQFYGKTFFFAFLFMLLATSCDSPSPNPSENEMLKELLALTRENEGLKARNKQLEEEIEVQKGKIAALNQEVESRNRVLVDLKRKDPLPSKIPKERISNVHPSDLVGKWKATLIFLKKTDDFGCSYNSSRDENWDISLTSEGLSILAQGKQYKGSLSGNKLYLGKATPYSPFLIRNQKEMRGEKIDSQGACAVTYEITLTKK